MIHEMLKGITDKELAARTGCCVANINMIRHGKRRPSPELAAKIEAITGIPLRTLLGLDSHEPGKEGEIMDST